MKPQKKPQKKQIITISGRPGSGKSTAAKSISEKLGYVHFSSGDLFRTISREFGHNVLQGNLAAEKADGVSDIDQKVDQKLRDIGEHDDLIVIDSRMAWHWIPFSFKVFLNLDLPTAAERILQSMDKVRIEAEHIPKDPKEYAKNLQNRLESESRRYKKAYDTDPYLIDNYDLVINTKTTSPEEVVSLIQSRYKHWLDI